MSLTGLDLLSNEFDDASIEVVESLSLAWFGSGSNRISDEAIARLKRAKPALQIREWRKQ